MAENSPMTALQKIQQSLAQKAQPTPATGILGQTEALETLSRAASGKAVTGGAGPSRSRQAEKQVASQVQKGQQALQEQIQAEALGQAIQTKAREDKAKLDNKILSSERLDIQEKFLAKQSEIITSFVRSGRELDLKKDKARAEQAGFMMRLNTDYYITDLQDEANRALLQDELQFNEELARTLFNEELALFNDDLDFRAMIAADEREFELDVANINIDFALKMAESEAAAASQGQMWSGFSTLVQAGVTYAAGQKEGGTTPEAPGGSAGGGTQPLASQPIVK